MNVAISRFHHKNEIMEYLLIGYKLMHHDGVCIPMEFFKNLQSEFLCNSGWKSQRELKLFRYVRQLCVNELVAYQQIFKSYQINES